MDVFIAREHIPSLASASKMIRIQKGFSFDQKYLIYHADEQPTHVLRTASIQQADRKKREFGSIDQVYRLGVMTSRPVEFGIIESMELCYMVLSYVIGEDASEVLPALSSDEQHSIGLQAGRELRLIHEIQAPADLEDWDKRRHSKHLRQLAEYRECGYRLPEEELILDFIHHHVKEMYGRPNRFQHDDFHPSNLLIHDRCYSGTIDFNRYDWGDPYHDFLKIAYFSRNDSIPFSIGQIEGYFEGEIPKQFWKLYALYNALIMLPTISWTLKVVPDQLDSMLDRIRIVLKDHRNFERVVPAWFTS